MAEKTELVVSESAVVAGNTIRASWQISLDKLRANIAPYPERTKEAIIGLFRHRWPHMGAR